MGLLLLTIALVLSCVDGFTGPQVRLKRARENRLPHQTQQLDRMMMTMMMVRNIDLPEALVFYKSSLVVETNDAGGISFREGVQGLLEEAQDVDAVAIVIHDDDDDDTTDDDADSTAAATEFLSKSKLVKMHAATQPPPNPRDLLEAISSQTIAPKGFGGSSGFGRKHADPIREPLPKHTVVFCATENQCRAAIYCGMRVICLKDNKISDAVIDDFESLYLDDVATPGSFWLNPPYARDDDGNKVDPIDIMKSLEANESNDEDDDDGSSVVGEGEAASATDEMADDEMARILADMDSL